MNQILNVDDINTKKPNKKEKKKKQKEKRNNNNYSNYDNYAMSGSRHRNSAIEIIKIVKFFAIALIIFGIFNIGTASYGIVKGKQQKENAPVKPTIEAEVSQSSPNKVDIKVSGKNTINELVYSWNKKEEVKVNGNNRTEFTETIILPAGDNTLDIRVTDSMGQVQTATKTFSREALIDIDVINASPKVKITLAGKDQVQIQSMTYRWNDEQATTLEVNAPTFEKEIDVPQGENTLKIEAVDINGNVETFEQEINGEEQPESAESSESTGSEGTGSEGTGSEGTGSEPQVVVTRDENAFIIDASDQVGIVRVEFVINESISKFKEVDNQKKFHDTYPLQEGENKIEVTVYNANGQTGTFRARLKK